VSDDEVVGLSFYGIEGLRVVEFFFLKNEKKLLGVSMWGFLLRVRG